MFEADVSGVLMNGVLVAPLKQERLECERFGLEDELQESEKGRVKAQAPRALEVHIEVEHALELVERFVRILVRASVPMIGRHEEPRMFLDAPYVLYERVDRFGLDASLEHGEALRREILDSRSLVRRNVTLADCFRQTRACARTQRPNVDEVVTGADVALASMDGRQDVRQCARFFDSVRERVRLVAKRGSGNGAAR